MNIQSYNLDRAVSTNTTKLLSNTLIRLVAFSLLIGFIVRIILLFSEQTQISFTFNDWLQIFLVGVVNDLYIAIICSFFMWLFLIFRSQSKYREPWGYIIFGLIAIMFCYVTFFNTIFDEYGSSVSKIVRYFLLFKLVSFGVRLFVPNIRNGWSKATYFVTFLLYVFLILFNAIGEYLFWDEFGVRYNFIAVDYLVYTHEVIGNIIESYPIVPLFTVLIIVSLGITYLFVRKGLNLVSEYLTFKVKLVVSGLYFVLFAISCVFININTKFQNNQNVYVNELQANGAPLITTSDKEGEEIDSAEDYAHVEIEYNEEKYVLEIYVFPTEGLDLKSYSFGNWVAEQDVEKATLQQCYLETSMHFGDDALTSFHLQLKVMNALVLDASLYCRLFFVATIIGRMAKMGGCCQRFSERYVGWAQRPTI